MQELPRITVGELRSQLEGIPDAWTVDFSGLTFYRVKQRAPTHVQIEFNEVVYRDANGHLVVRDLGRDDG